MAFFPVFLSVICVGHNQGKQLEKILDQWATDNGVELRLIQPGKPT